MSQGRGAESDGRASGKSTVRGVWSKSRVSLKPSVELAVEASMIIVTVFGGEKAMSKLVDCVGFCPRHVDAGAFAASTINEVSSRKTRSAVRYC